MKKPLFQKVCIVGVGLIGGSLGLAIKRKRLARMVVGVARRRSTVDEALGREVLDAATLRLDKGVSDADLVILCAPVYQILKQIQTLKPLLKPGAVVIDVGSSKGRIVSAAKKYLKGHSFVGCHPMAGSEKCGIEFADTRLFEGAVCFITAHHPKVEALWKGVGAKTVRIDPASHDTWVAKASHFPHVSAFVQFLMLERTPRTIETHLRGRINPSLRSAARLSRSNPELWAEILLSNREQVLRSLDEAGRWLGQLKSSVRKGRSSTLRGLIARANRSSRRLAPDDGK